MNIAQTQANEWAVWQNKKTVNEQSIFYTAIILTRLFSRRPEIAGLPKKYKCRYYTNYKY